MGASVGQRDKTLTSRSCRLSAEVDDYRGATGTLRKKEEEEGVGEEEKKNT